MTGHEPWTIRRVLDWTKGYLAEKGIENARLETEWLLAEGLGLDRVGLYVNFDLPLTDVELTRIREMVSRRAKREPLQYILGSQEFAGLDFAVSPAVLIPRHDTEVLLAEALRVGTTAKRVLDIGTGSGCLAIALAKQIPGARITAVDISAGALAVAKSNAEHHSVTVDFFLGSLFDPLQNEVFDLIISNPPYIVSSDIETLQPEVRDFEPRSALDGGTDGFSCYRELIPAALDHLSPDGWLLVEVGAGQAEEVEGIFAASGFCAVFTVRDPAGIQRVTGGRKKTPSY